MSIAPALSLGRFQHEMGYEIVSIHQPDKGDGMYDGDYELPIWSPGPTPEDDAISSERKEHIERMLVILTPRQRQVIMYLYGLNNHKETGCVDLSKLFNITPTSIYKIERRSLDILRRAYWSEMSVLL